MNQSADTTQSARSAPDTQSMFAAHVNKISELNAELTGLCEAVEKMRSDLTQGFESDFDAGAIEMQLRSLEPHYWRSLAAIIDARAESFSGASTLTGLTAEDKRSLDEFRVSSQAAETRFEKALDDALGAIRVQISDTQGDVYGSDAGGDWWGE